MPITDKDISLLVDMYIHFTSTLSANKTIIMLQIMDCFAAWDSAL